MSPFAHFLTPPPPARAHRSTAEAKAYDTGNALAIAIGTVMGVLALLTVL